jgi:hypothetical protein
MIKKLIKILSIALLIIVPIIFYLSFFGIKTERFNETISKRILEINNKIKLDLKGVKFLLNPYNFTVNITTKDPKILLEGHQILIKDIRTKVSLKSLIIDEFSINDLEIRTETVKLDDWILLGRSFQNSTQLFLLDRFIKGGALTANIKLKFDNTGKIKDDYQISGLVENCEFDILNKFNVENLNFNFEISKKKYTLSEVGVKLNNIKASLPIIEINKRNNLFFVNGKALINEKNFNINQLNFLLGNSLKMPNIKKINFNSINKFSFNINKKLKFNNLKINSKIKLDQLVHEKNILGIKALLPNYNGTTIFENHEILINFSKKKLEIKGKGEVLVADKSDFFDYQIIKENNESKFNIKINLKNNKLLVNFLDYEKKEDSDSQILIKGNYKKDDSIKFDTISLKEKDNKLLLKNLNLDKKFKIRSVDIFDLDFINNNNIQNQIYLKKNNSNYTINGKSFDASKIIDAAMKDETNSTIFSKLNIKISLNINKTYIDEINFINDLSGALSFKNNQIDNLNLESTFPNKKKINLLIKKNDKQEKITKLFTNYPKPLVRRYNFIKGFEEGYLNFYSIKKNNISNSILVIDDFKIKEVPVFAKLLSLASLQGIADLLTGEGIRFTDFEMKFTSNKKLITIEEMYAIGPAVSILMDGYIESKKLVSLRGTLVPATTINRSIASIPLLGNILVGKKTGEGVFGVSFKIKGKPKDLKTTVNPIKTLTPRFITRTLEKIQKN